jgi:hypothetical protein
VVEGSGGSVNEIRDLKLVRITEHFLLKVGKTGKGKVRY